MATQTKNTTAKSASKSATKSAAKKNTKSAAKFRPSVRVVKTGNFKVATVTTLKDGTKKVATGGCVYTFHPNGSVTADVRAQITLDKGDDGKWHAYYWLGDDFGNLVELLKNEMDGKYDLSGNLEDGGELGVFTNCSEGYAQSEPLTDEQAAKVRAYFPTFDDVK